MASGKIGSLVYDVIADTRQFTKGLIPAKKELTAFNRMMIATRTPMEKLGIEFDGIARVAKSGLAPIDALSRTVGQLAVETKGGGREAREFAQSLRQQAGAIGGAHLGTQKLTEAEKNLQNHLRAVADASEQEVNALRAKRAETLRAERADKQAAESAAQQAAADKKSAAEAKEAATAEAAKRKQIEQTIAARQRAVQQESAARTSRVQSMVAGTEAPQLALSRQLAEARQERDAGNISQKQFLAVQQNIVAEAKKLNPIYEQQAQELKQQKDAADALLKRQKAIADAAAKAQQQSRQKGIDAAKGIASQGEAARLSRVRSEVEATVPAAKKLAARMAEVRQEFAAGNITQEEFARVQERIARELNELSPAFAKQQKEAAESDARMQKLRATYASLVTPQQAVQNEIRELGQEFRAGNITGEMHTKLLTHLTNKYNALKPEVVEANAQLERVRRTVERSIKPTDKLEKEERELREQFKKGKVDIKDYERALIMLRKEKTKHKTTTSKAVVEEKKFGNQLVAIGKHIGVVTLGYKALNVVQQAFNDQLEIERSQKQFEIFTGSAVVAAKLMEDIRGFSARTPITLEGGQQAVRTLMQYGVSADVVIKRLKQLGDISGGSLESLQRLSLAFGQISANGKLQGQELRQLIEAGFNPLQVMSEKTGESMSELRERMADGAISINDVEDALKAATGEGGRFNKMLEKVGSETNFGAVQRLGGEMRKALADKAEGAADAAGNLSNTLANMIGDKPQQIADIATEIEKLRVKLAIDSSRDIGGLPFFLDPKGAANVRNMTYLGYDLDQVLAKAQSQLTHLKSLRDESLAINELRERPFVGVGGIIGELVDEKTGAAKNIATGVGKLVQNRFSEIAEMMDVDRLAKQAIAMLARDDANSKKERERILEEEFGDLQKNSKEFAERIRDSLKTPFEKLAEEIKQIQQSMFLDAGEQAQAIKNIFAKFAKENKKDIAASQSATAATEGSREEFQLLAQINRQNQDTQRRHNEAQGLREKMFGALRDNAGAVNNLPAALAELFPEPVGE